VGYRCGLAIQASSLSPDFMMTSSFPAMILRSPRSPSRHSTPSKESKLREWGEIIIKGVVIINQECSKDSMDIESKIEKKREKRGDAGTKKYLEFFSF
jgi:hypothetical protein